MRKPRDMQSAPRGDWRYYQKETDMHFREMHPRTMENAVFQHRLQNPDLHLQISGNWQQQLWHEICSQNEGLDCEDTEDKGTWPNLVDVWNFIKTLWNWKSAGGTFVEQAEAERRAKACLTGANGQPCPHNRVFAPCMGCRGVSDEIARLLEGRSTPYDQKLHLCDACGGCQLASKIHFPLEVISVDESKLPSFCWQRRLPT